MTGGDDMIAQSPNGPVQRHENAGLRLVDTRTWQQTVLDKDVDWFAWTGDSSSGSRTRFNGSSCSTRTATSASGRTLLAANGVQVAGGRAYLTLGNEYRRHRVRVVDLESGRTLRTVWVPGWFYPLSRESPEICWC